MSYNILFPRDNRDPARYVYIRARIIYTCVYVHTVYTVFVGCYNNNSV